MAVVTLVNCFDIPAGREDEFFRLWREVNAYMCAQPGYLGHQLHRALTADASFRFSTLGGGHQPSTSAPHTTNAFARWLASRAGRRSVPTPGFTRSYTKARPTPDRNCAEIAIAQVALQQVSGVRVLRHQQGRDSRGR